MEIITQASPIPGITPIQKFFMAIAVRNFPRKLPVIPFEKIMEILELSDKSMSLRRLRRLFTEGVDFTVTRRRSTGGRPSDEILLTVDTFKAFCMTSDSPKSHEVWEYYLDLEAEFFGSKELSFSPKPVLALLYAYDAGMLTLPELRMYMEERLLRVVSKDDVKQLITDIKTSRKGITK